MSVPVITLLNTTGSPITLTNLGLTIPASPGSIDATGSDGFVSVSSLIDDPQLHSEIDAGNITVTVDGVVFNGPQSSNRISPLVLLDRLHNLNASAIPTATDDEDAGYAIGSQWFDTTNEVAHFCIDASAGAAVWLTMLSVAGGGGFILGWGGAMNGSGKFMGAWQGASGGEFANIRAETELTCPKAGTSSTLAWNSELADTDTIIKIHKNGIVADTITLDGVSGTVPTVTSFAKGDTISLEYDTGTAPKKSTWLLYVIP